MLRPINLSTTFGSIMKNARTSSLMIIDDDSDDRMVFSESVNKVDESIRCIEATNGQDGYDQLLTADTLPDFIFVDVNMPNMTGFQLLSKIRNTEKLRNLKVIMYTTSSQKSAKETARTLGANGFLTKPEQVQELVNYISRLVHGHGTDVFIEVGLLALFTSVLAVL